MGISLSRIIRLSACLSLACPCGPAAGVARAAEAPPAVISPTVVEGLRVEYRVDPLAIDVPDPRLSWRLQSAERGALQTAYQVLVASTPERLEPGKTDLWDSGKVASSRSTQIVYAGPALRSRARCHWRVRVWDEAGRTSAWSPVATWTMGLLAAEDWQARWIGGTPVRTPGAGALLPATYLRKEFRAKGEVRRALLHATAAGVYEFHMNGHRVGNDIFAPGWTEYAKRLFYQAYDVTKLLVPNRANAIGATLADGWYGLHHGGRGSLRLKAQLSIDYADGSTEVVATDPSWRVSFAGPVLSSDMYQGETYDARRDLGPWSEAGYDDAAWAAAADETAPQGAWADATEKVRAALKDGSLSIEASNTLFGDPIFGVVKRLEVDYTIDGEAHSAKAPEGKKLEIAAPGRRVEILRARFGADTSPADVRRAAMQAHPGPPVRKSEEIHPVKITEPKPGAFVYDLGQNFTGWARLTVSGPAGTKVTLRFAEMLNPDGTIYTTNLRGAKCTDVYVLSGRGKEVWEPRFTFHGFQYVEVTGYPGAPTLEALTGIVVHSAAPPASSFECSNPMLDRLWKNIVWGQRSNYLEVPTDCPQRDERLGWTGDAQAFIGTGTYNQDLSAFFTAWLITLGDSQRPDGGYTDVSPHGGGVSAGWSDAGVVCPWTLWKMYGDTRVIERHFDGMMRWIEHCERNSKGLLRPAEGYGDWLNLGAELPKDVIATAYFAFSTRLLESMARTIGKTAEADRLAALFTRIRSAFTEAYVSADGRVKGDTQTAYLMALAFDLVPEARRPALEKLLLERIAERGGHLSTGFLGVNLLLPTLTAIGRDDVAYALLQKETYPSWGYPVKHGATTIWERWDGWTEDRGFQDPGMNSFNHYAYGSCGQWMFETMLGIRTDGPGFDRLILAPRPGGGLRFARGSYESIRGRIAVAWELADGHIRLGVTIPAGVTAAVRVPTGDPESVREGGVPAGKAAGVRSARAEPGALVLEAGSGSYVFEAKAP